MATADSTTAQSQPVEVPKAGEPLPKDDMIAWLQNQPADSTYDELLRQLLLLRSIRRGLADADAGRVRSHEEVVELVKSWRK